jgi:hypothetical protein
MSIDDYNGILLSIHSLDIPLDSLEEIKTYIWNDAFLKTNTFKAFNL